MRFCSVWNPATRGPFLCAVEAGNLLVVGEGALADVAELAERGDAGADLAGLARAAGIASTSLARWEDVDTPTGVDTAQIRLATPVRPAEVWAAGVTYARSRDARVQESADGDVYSRVYFAERPELFFKATGARVVGPGGQIGVRADAGWQVPEPELALVVGRGGRVLGYTLGNDVSARDIEGENPLYLPQAKIFAGSCALGPIVVSADEVPDPTALTIVMRILRGGAVLFEGATETARLHVALDVLVRYLALENWLPPLTVLLTGAGVVPPDDVSLLPGDVVEISCEPIGLLRNTCAPAATLTPPGGWWQPAQ